MCSTSFFSEYKVKRFIEPDALLGQEYNEIKARRSVASGAKSSESRRRRVLSLLTCMEKLVRDNPALGRFPPNEVAEVARNDAVTSDPQLWGQGANQYLDYLGEIRRGEAGEDLKTRFETMFPPKPLKRMNRRGQSG